ncbi:hypothetical protein VNI00_018389, partial [Paramarasmius palmivorus]
MEETTEKEGQQLRQRVKDLSYTPPLADTNQLLEDSSRTAVVARTSGDPTHPSLRSTNDLKAIQTWRLGVFMVVRYAHDADVHRRRHSDHHSPPSPLSPSPPRARHPKASLASGYVQSGECVTLVVPEAITKPLDSGEGYEGTIWPTYHTPTPTPHHRRLRRTREPLYNKPGFLERWRYHEA